MCGIFVVYNLNKQVDKKALVEATIAVSHRGPDNQGYFTDDFCFMGHTRLSILGLEKESNQPFHYQNLIMVYNGEIFNYLEIRKELIKHGYIFETRSDSEVVLKAFHKWGGNCFSKFNGMWAIVIYDKKKHTIVVSRDRFGQKPLFIYRKDGVVYFASEVQQLIPLSERKIDFELIQLFLKEGNYKSEGRTFFRDIEIFPKAYYCIIDTNRKYQFARYWTYWPGAIKKADERDMDDFALLLHDAVKLRLRADVPYGLLLSGGVDSTIIAALSKKNDQRDTAIPAFTYASRDNDDESKYAGEIAEHLNLYLQIREQDQNPEDYCRRLKKIVKHMGRGHSSPAIVSVDYLYELVAECGIKVALDGQGADELLSGYPTYFPLIVPIYILKGEVKQVMMLLKLIHRYGLTNSVILFMRNTMPSVIRKIMRWIYGYERFFSTDFPRYRPRKRFPNIVKSKNKNIFNRYWTMQHDIGLENLLFYGDIVAMRHGVENRSPFLDHRLVDFAFSIDENLKIWNGEDKYVLRRLPEYRKFKQLLDRNKIGFSSNIKKETKMYIIDILRNSPILRWPIFRKRLYNFIRSNDAMAAKYERFIFRLYQVHLWNEIFIPVAG